MLRLSKEHEKNKELKVLILEQREKEQKEALLLEQREKEQQEALVIQKREKEQQEALVIQKRENSQKKTLLVETDIANTNECCVCLEKTRNTVLVPCHHMCLCESCAEDIMKNLKASCPLCRAEVQKTIKIFL